MAPSKKWYWLALLIFLAGPLLGLYLLFHSVYSAAKHGITFYVPGTASIYIVHPGQYTLWMENQHPNLANQVEYNLHNMTLRITDPTTQKTTTLKPKIGWSSNQGKAQHYSLGTVRFDHTGTYQFVTTSPQYTPYKVYLRQPSLMTVIKALAISLLVALLGIVSGILFAIIILIKRMSTKIMEQPNDEPKTDSTKQQTPELAPPPEVSHEATTWAMICHLSGFAGFVFPFANIIAPLLIWGFKRHDYPFLDSQGKEAINFQISVTIYYIVAAFLILLVVGLFLLPLIAAFHIIAMIIASVEAAQGRPFKYPLTIRFLK